ncbi:MAG: hypothetical protein ACI4SV_01245 [Duodenibacillus sp.]
MMKTEDRMRLMADETIELLLDKVDRIIDKCTDSGYTSHESVECLKDCWKTICIAKQHAEEGVHKE